MKFMAGRLAGKCHPWSLTLFLFSALNLAGQTEQQPPKFDVRVNLVALDVEVLDPRGNQIAGLAKQDFVVEENGRSVEITNFAISTDRPVSLVVVLDTSTLTTTQLSVCKMFLLDFIHKLDRSDQICLYSFDQRDAYLEQDFTEERTLLLDSLDNIGVPSKRSPRILAELFGNKPPTALAIDLALRKLKDARKSKKALLLISNRFSGLGPVTVEHVQESGITLATLAFSHKTSMLVSLGGDEISSRKLMRESGGRQFSAESKDIPQLCHQVALSLKNYYSIGYLTEIKAGDKKPRKIQIRIPGRKCSVHFRRTYVPE
jgi:hypothetical protein